MTSIASIDHASIATKLRDLRAQLVSRFPERQAAIDGCIASALASEHALLLGPPGTAKSALARSIAQAFGGRYFERLLTKHSTPDEVFGPISLKGLEEGRFERVVAGKLPEAEFALIDECFKANSAILNGLLGVMNERIFHNDAQVIACQLVTMLGASNELPEGKDLEAFLDRFLLRIEVKYVEQHGSFRAVMTAPDPTPIQVMSMAELRAAQQAVAGITITPDTVEGLAAIREACAQEGIVASDRRWKKALKLVQAAAFTMDEERTSVEDLSIITDTLWREPKERDKVARLVAAHSDPVRAKVVEVVESARELAQSLVVVKKTDPVNYIPAAARAVAQFAQQKAVIDDLSKSAGKRAKTAVADAVVEIQAMHAETQRAMKAAIDRPLV